MEEEHFLQWRAAQPYFLQSEPACAAARLCWTIVTELLNASLSVRDEGGIEALRDTWVRGGQSYLEVLGRFLWTRSRHVERVLRAVELYAISQDINRPPVGVRSPFAEDLTPAATAASRGIAFDGQRARLADIFEERLKVMKEQRLA